MLAHTREERQARLAGTGVQCFQLTELGRGIIAEPEYATHGKDGTTLVKDGGLRVVLEAIRQGARLSEHRAPGRATIHVLDGELRFESEGEVFYLTPGDLLVMPKGNPHTVEAVRDSLYLLTFVIQK